jgi:GNAT superfamily N-acetyltransferase
VGVEPPAAYAAPVPVAPDHRIDGFDCGKPQLGDWLKGQALANEGRSARTYVVVATAGAQAGQVVGYYTLATGGVARSEVPGKIRHGLPNPVPVMLLGRLAVDARHQGQGLGPAMLKEAMQRTMAIAQAAGVRALLVHAIDDDAVTFYQRYGFILFPADSRTLFLPIETLIAALQV